ncbi:MAG: 2-oxoacid:acceptor oxidoreductase subunit alpha [Alphaproteobacteria bacterium]|jgi:2-oxoglutarate ferredoxin oxidoreductase subunit alpha|nr:2-oxoacid:acceptor oxidoreductase subunit alpha [Alphaproteobacteria bacterium]MDP6814343.1 2-oxoacid:acceptor oxidoreductase subunit alpha [Alphaproteobacteria bacterium]
MDTTTKPDLMPGTDGTKAPAAADKTVQTLDEHIVEIVSDSGEGAQKCGQSFAAIAARMGNGIWTVEIIPAEIQPPARSIEGASGNRIRVGANYVTNGGDETDLVVALNEQVLLGRVRTGELKPGCTILLENKWRDDRDEEIVASYTQTHDELVQAGFRVYEIPMEEECLRLVPDPKRGKNMFVLGILCNIHSFELQMARDQIAFIFGNKSQAVIDANIELLEAGHDWAECNLDFKYRIPATKASEPQIVVNGNTALALGVLASGMQVCAMYPITPATSASHYLSDIFEKVGGIVHQAEDEIAACAFAIGASYSGSCALTITSGPGYSLKQEAIGLAVMGEIPLVVVDVQRGGPSTGQPTKAEQGDLLFACFGGHGDGPKVVMAAASIEDCFYSMITARKIAETFNMVVVVLTDANLATAQQPFKRPDFSEDWIAPALDQSALPEAARPYDWDETTGIARRFIPGQPDGMHCLTGLAHDRDSAVAYDPLINQEGMERRSLKLATLQKTLTTPTVYGDPEGELLVIGWGSSKGAIEEAVDRVRQDGHKVSSLHLTFLQPLPSGLKEILHGFKSVMTVENSWSDDPASEIIDEDNRRYSNLAWLLRARYLVDIDCWSEVKGQPLKPGTVARVITEHLQ